MATELWAMGLVIVIGLIGGISPIYLKKGAEMMTRKDYSTIYKNYYLMISILIAGVTTVLFIIALKGGELSVLYPLVGLSYVWVCFYSKYMLNEEMNFLKWIGIGTIVVGVSLIGIGA